MTVERVIAAWRSDAPLTDEQVTTLVNSAEAMMSTLVEAENHVPESTMKLLRRHYASEVTAAREYAEARS